MIVTWMVYCSLCALGLALAAGAAERLLLAGRAPVRVVWVGALLFSVALPLAVFRVSSSPPPVVTIAPAEPSNGFVAGPVADAATQLPTAPPTATRSWRTVVSERARELDTPLMIVWAALSGALAVSFAGGVIALAWMRRRWEPRIVQDVRVYVSRRTGPAVVGAFKPSIVVPEWAMALPANQLSLMLRHEREHLRARDGQLLIAAQIALIAMPWNVALWWQVLRLRVAIEMDCDARVLRVADARSYGELLLEVARPHRSFKLAGMIAFAERASQLERRIRFLKRHRVATSKRAVVAAGTVTLLALSVAWAAPHPTAPTHDNVFVTLPNVSSLPITTMDAARKSPASTTISVPKVRAALFSVRLRDCASDTTLVGSTYRFVYDGVKLSRDNESKACELLARLVDEQLAEDVVAQATAMDLRSRRLNVQSQRNASLAALLTTDADRATFSSNLNRMMSATAAPDGMVARGRVSGSGTMSTMAPPPGGIGGGGGRVGRASFTGDSVIVQSDGPAFVRERVPSEELQRRLKNASAELAATAERANVKMITTNDGGVVNTVTQVTVDTLARDAVLTEGVKLRVQGLLSQAARQMTYETLFNAIQLSPDQADAAKRIIDDAQTTMNNVGAVQVPPTRLRVNRARGVALVTAGADSALVDLAPIADRAAVRARLVPVPQ